MPYFGTPVMYDTHSACSCIASGSLLKHFKATDTPDDALIMAWLVADLSRLVTDPGVADAARREQVLEQLKNKWALYGAKASTINIRQLSSVPTFGASFLAGHTTFIITSTFLGDVDVGDRTATVPYSVRQHTHMQHHCLTESTVMPVHAAEHACHIGLLRGPRQPQG